MRHRFEYKYLATWTITPGSVEVNRLYTSQYEQLFIELQEYYLRLIAEQTHEIEADVEFRKLVNFG